MSTAKESSAADRPRLMVGAMSGTSCDGVDAALIKVSGRGEGMRARYVAHLERPFAADFRRRLLAVREAGGCSFAELAEIGRTLTLAYAAAVNDLLAEAGATDVAAVAAHGQTLYHAPPDTIQWLDPSLLAAETGLQVVSDFRRADCAAGGQGAPLVPFADWVFFRHPTKTRVILNLGGIANLTYLPAGGGVGDVIAFDTGPGCCLSDWIARERGVGEIDRDGDLAATGDGGCLWAIEWMEEQHYPALRPPKSTDTAEVIAAYRIFRETRSIPAASCSAADELSKAAKLVATSIVEQMVVYLEQRADVEVFVGGGGARNRAIVAALDYYLVSYGVTTSSLRTLDALGLPAQAREAACFAVLGAATLDGEPANVPSATGASGRVVLGSVTPKPRR